MAVSRVIKLVPPAKGVGCVRVVGQRRREVRVGGVPKGEMKRQKMNGGESEVGIKDRS